MPFLRKHWPVLFLALIPLIPLWKAVFLGQVIGPFDQIRQMAPWNGPAPEEPWDVLAADGVLQTYVWRDLVFESWGKGQAPLTNPYQLAGAPLAANSQSAAFYPPHMVLGLLHVPTAWAITLLAWVHLFWAGLGAFWLARRLGADALGGAVAGGAFSLSAFMLAWLPLASVVSTISWIPWVLVCALGLMPPVRRRNAEEAATEAPSRTASERLRSVAGLAASVGMMLLAGHLQFAAYGFLALAVLTLGLLFPSLRSRAAHVGAGLVFAGAVCGVLLAAIQLVPVMAFSKESHRRNTPTDEGYQAYIAGALSGGEAVAVLFPSLLGNPTVRAAPESPLSAYYPAITHRGTNFAETAAGIGAATFVGLLFVPWRRLRAAHLSIAAMGLLAGLLAFGTPLNRLFYFGVPGWSSTGSPGRGSILLILAACALAGVGVTRILKERPQAKAMRVPLAIGGLVAAGSILAAFVRAGSLESWIPALDVEAVRGVAFTAIGAALPGIVVVLLAASFGLQAMAAGFRGAKFIVLGATAFAPVLTLGPGFVRTGAPDFVVDLGVAPHERVAFVNEGWELLAAAPALMPPNTASLLRIHDIAGYDSLMSLDTVNLLHEIVGGDAAPPVNGNIQFIKPGFDPAKLAEAGVAQVFARAPIDGLSAEPLPSGIYRHRLPSKGRAFTQNGTATIEEESAAGIVLVAEGPGQLIVRDRQIGEWQAWIDGVEAPVLPGRWLTVELRDGKHRVELRPRLSGSVWVSAVVGLGLLAAWILGLRTGNRTALESP